MTIRTMFIHHVYFWLSEPGNEEHLQRLVGALQKLSHAATIRQFHIGLPAATRRNVIDHSYSVSWMLLFDDEAGEEAYQIDPLHLEFVAANSMLWKKVVVYDSIGAVE